MQWLLGKRFKPEQVFTERFIRNLHKRMYKNVWKWAGDFRKSQKNLGIEYWNIPSEVKVLCEDALYWLEHETYPPDEFAIRFKHRIVSIHCFPNGNGRHSRLMADIIIEKLFDKPVFSWGAANLSKTGDARSTYLTAIKAADRGDYVELLQFARS